MRSTISDINGTLYCNLYNYENTFCWFLSVLHKLHSSRTLNEILKNSDVDNELLKPLKMYSNLTRDNYIKVYDDIKYWFEYAYQYVFNESSRRGHDSVIGLYYLYLPLIHHYYRDRFQDIINELNIEYINSVESTIHSAIYDRPIVNNPDTIYEYYKEMVNDDSYCCKVSSPFCCGILTISPNKDNKNLHAICLIKTVDKYVVLDDQNAQKDICQYIKEHSPNHLYSIVIKDISDKDAQELNQYLSNNRITSQFNSTVYGYKLKDIVITGGELDKYNILTYVALVSLVIVLIYVAVIGIIYINKYDKLSKKYNEITSSRQTFIPNTNLRKTFERHFVRL